MRNKVVAHFLDGHLVKGVTLDFLPTKDAFHMFDPENEREVTQVATKDLKAIFFVKSFAGRPSYGHRGNRVDYRSVPGRKLRVTFRDGEVMIGTASAYVPGRAGFFVVPLDPEENNERIYIFAHATKGVETITPSVAV